MRNCVAFTDELGLAAGLLDALQDDDQCERDDVERNVHELGRSIRANYNGVRHTHCTGNLHLYGAI